MKSILLIHVLLVTFLEKSLIGRELSLEPGDAIGVQKLIVDGKAVWCLAPISEPALSWMGRFRKKARGKRHDMGSIRRSIRRARMKGDA